MSIMPTEDIEGYRLFCEFNQLDMYSQAADVLWADYLEGGADEDGLEREEARMDREGWYDDKAFGDRW